MGLLGALIILIRFAGVYNSMCSSIAIWGHGDMITSFARVFTGVVHGKHGKFPHFSSNPCRVVRALDSLRC